MVQSIPDNGDRVVRESVLVLLWQMDGIKRRSGVECGGWLQSGKVIQINVWVHLLWGGGGVIDTTQGR